MGTFPLLVSLDTRSTIDIDLPSCMSPSSDVFAVFLRILRCPVWHSMSHCHSVTVSRYAMPYHVMSWGLESIYCLSKRLQVFGLTASLLSVCYVLGKQDKANVSIWWLRFRSSYAFEKQSFQPRGFGWNCSSNTTIITQHRSIYER